MGPDQQHHIRNAVLCLKYLLGAGDLAGALEQVRRIDRAMQADDPVCRWRVRDLEGLIDGAPRPVIEELMRLCERALEQEATHG